MDWQGLNQCTHRGGNDRVVCTSKLTSVSRITVCIISFNRSPYKCHLPICPLRSSAPTLYDLFVIRTIIERADVGPIERADVGPKTAGSEYLTHF